MAYAISLGFRQSWMRHHSQNILSKFWEKSGVSCFPRTNPDPKWQHLQEKVSSLKGVPLLLIIDNVPLADPSRISEIQSILAEIADCRWIMLCSQDEGARTSDVGKVFPQPTQVLFIQDLPRKAIRELSRKRNDLLEDNDLLVSVRRLCELFELVAGPDGLSA